MATTVIDQLIITLGLDPTNFTKGQKEAAKSLTETTRTVRVSAEDMTKSLMPLVKQLGGLFLGFESLKGFGSFLVNLNTTEAALGRVSANLGVGVHDLNRWNTAVQLANGGAGDAQGALQGLADAWSNFRIKGEVSPLLYFMQQLGVRVSDDGVKLRDMSAIFEDLANKVQERFKGDRVLENSMLRQVGLSQEFSNYLTLQQSQRAALNAQAEENNRITEKSVAQAQDLENRWVNIRNITKGWGAALLGELQPPIEGLLVLLTKFGNFLSSKKADGAIDYHNVKGPAGEIISGMAYLYEYLSSFAKNAVDPARTVGDTRGLRNNNPGNIKALPGTKYASYPKDPQGFAIFPDTNTGLAALEDQVSIARKRGGNTITGIVNDYEGKDAPGNHNDIEAYIRDLMQATGRGRNDQLSDSDIRNVIRAMIDHEQYRGAAAQLGVGGPGAPVGKAGTTIRTHIDAVNVYTQATDADGIASSIGGALQRKQIVDQSNGGLS